MIIKNGYCVGQFISIKFIQFREMIKQISILRTIFILKLFESNSKSCSRVVLEQFYTLWL